jgi:tyrosyl-tRNA synthetase
MVHGEAAAQEAERAAAALFGGEGEAAGSIPASRRSAADLAGEGLPLTEALVDSGLCKSKGEARRLVRQQGVRVNGRVVADELYLLGPADVQDGRIALQVGKKRHHHIQIDP